MSYTFTFTEAQHAQIIAALALASQTYADASVIVSTLEVISPAAAGYVASMCRERGNLPPADRYYVCDLCAHTYSAPERPDRCENCGHRDHYAYDTLADAEKQSEAILRIVRAIR